MLYSQEKELPDTQNRLVNFCYSLNGIIFTLNNEITFAFNQQQQIWPNLILQYFFQTCRTPYRGIMKQFSMLHVLEANANSNTRKHINLQVHTKN